jgi:hypothetical protein
MSAIVLNKESDNRCHWSPGKLHGKEVGETTLLTGRVCSPCQLRSKYRRPLPQQPQKGFLGFCLLGNLRQEIQGKYPNQVMGNRWPCCRSSHREQVLHPNHSKMPLLK